jgi:hypothetical protein
MREETRKTARRAIRQAEKGISAVPTSPEGGATEMKHLRYAVQSLFEALFDIIEEEPEVIDISRVGTVITDVDEMMQYPKKTVFTSNVDGTAWQRVHATAVGAIGITRYYDLVHEPDADSVQVSAPFTVRHVPEPTP